MKSDSTLHCSNLRLSAACGEARVNLVEIRIAVDVMFRIPSQFPPD
jgi:hypothetical protein